MIKEAIQQAVDYALKTVGLETFKKTSLFMSNRPTGFYAGLTDEQKKAALQYRGPEVFGDNGFRKEGDAS